MADLTPEQIQQRQRIHNHNGFLGPIAMMMQAVKRMNLADTLTPEARQKANDLVPHLQELSDLLKIRVDP